MSIHIEYPSKDDPPFASRRWLQDKNGNFIFQWHHLRDIVNRRMFKNNLMIEYVERISIDMNHIETNIFKLQFDTVMRELIQYFRMKNINLT